MRAMVSSCDQQGGGNRRDAAAVAIVTVGVPSTGEAITWYWPDGEDPVMVEGKEREIRVSRGGGGEGGGGGGGGGGGEKKQRHNE